MSVSAPLTPINFGILHYFERSCWGYLLLTVIILSALEGSNLFSNNAEILTSSALAFLDPSYEEYSDVVKAS